MLVQPSMPVMGLSQGFFEGVPNVLLEIAAARCPDHRIYTASGSRNYVYIGDGLVRSFASYVLLRGETFGN